MPRSGLRSCARGLVQAPVNPDVRSSPEIESSDGDDDIPASKLPSSSPPKRLAAPSANLHARPAKRPRSDLAQNPGIVLYHGSKNLRNGYNLKPVKRTSLPHSITSHPRAPIALTETTSRPESLRTSPEDGVRDGLLSSVNDAFRRRSAHAIQAGAPTSYSLDDTEHEELGGSGIGTDSQDSYPPSATPPRSVNPDALTSNKNPKQAHQNTDTETLSADEAPHRGNRDGGGAPTQRDNALPSRGDVPEPSPRPGAQEEGSDVIPHSKENLSPPKKRGRPPKKRGRPPKNPTQSETQDAKDVDTASEYEEGLQSGPVSGSDTDSENGNDGDQHSYESFMQDVGASNNRQTFHDEDDEAFEGPEEDDHLAIHLDPRPLKELCKLLSLKGWIGTTVNWQWRPFECNTARTGPGRALISVLVKLERLYQATPKAPDLNAQNLYLKEFAGTLRKYFHKIKIIVEHIRTRRLVILKPEEPLEMMDRCQRKRMAKDLVSCVVPMLVHILASIWKLGAREWCGGSFTGATVELLNRALGWVMALYHRLRAELERSPLEGKAKNKSQEQVWNVWNARRKEIGPLLEDLYQVIEAAPDQLAEADAYAKELLRHRELARRKQRQLQIEQQAEQQAAEEARRAQVAERKKRSLLSIHGIYYGLEPPATSSQPPPPPPPTREPVKWSIEEQRVLFLRIQASFPLLPDFGDLHWKLNKTVVETADMAEHILGKMLDIVLVGYSPEERVEEVRKIMRGSQVTG